MAWAFRFKTLLLAAVVALLLCPVRARRRLTIAFHTNQLDTRGTTRAIADYAHYARELLGHTPLLVVPTLTFDVGVLQPADRAVVLRWLLAELAARPLQSAPAEASCPPELAEAVMARRRM